MNRLIASPPARQGAFTPQIPRNLWVDRICPPSPTELPHRNIFGPRDLNTNSENARRNCKVDAYNELIRACGNANKYYWFKYVKESHQDTGKAIRTADDGYHRWHQKDVKSMMDEWTRKKFQLSHGTTMCITHNLKFILFEFEFNASNVVIYLLKREVCTQNMIPHHAHEVVYGLQSTMAEPTLTWVRTRNATMLAHNQEPPSTALSTRIALPTQIARTEGLSYAVHMTPEMETMDLANGNYDLGIGGNREETSQQIFGSLDMELNASQSASLPNIYDYMVPNVDDYIMVPNIDDYMMDCNVGSGGLEDGHYMLDAGSQYEMGYLPLWEFDDGYNVTF